MYSDMDLKVGVGLYVPNLSSYLCLLTIDRVRT